jgi:hypothetical protein
MITTADLIMLNDYLEENAKVIMSRDKARITRLQNIAKHFDPLQDEEPQMFIEPKPKELECGRCGYSWTYRGTRYRGYINCANGHAVRINPRQVQT